MTAHTATTRLEPSSRPHATDLRGAIAIGLQEALGALEEAL